MYRLTPVDACRLNLVKKIQVFGVTERDNFKSAEAAREYGLVDEVLVRRPDESIQAG